MRYRFATRASLWSVALACSVALPGCTKPSRPPEPPPGSGTRVSRVGNAVAACPHWGDRVVCVIWFDVKGTSAGVGQKFYGDAHLPDGRELRWECVSSDGEAGTVRIGTSSYDLAQGTLFLVSARGPDPQVRQLRHDVSGLSADGDSIRRLVTDHPEVSAFVANAPKSE